MTGRTALACVFFSATFISVAASAETLRGRVVSVHDGDTLTLLDDGNHQHKIRLAGIDAPELRQPFGRASRAQLAATVVNQIVIVNWHKKDKYGRLVGKVLRDSTDVCLIQITAGLAWHYIKYASEQIASDRNAYEAAEAKARASRIGLWVDAEPIPPWRWRQSAQ